MIGHHQAYIIGHGIDPHPEFEEGFGVLVIVPSEADHLAELPADEGGLLLFTIP